MTLSDSENEGDVDAWSGLRTNNTMDGSESSWDFIIFPELSKFSFWRSVDGDIDSKWLLPKNSDFSTDEVDGISASKKLAIIDTFHQTTPYSLLVQSVNEIRFPNDSFLIMIPPYFSLSNSSATFLKPTQSDQHSYTTRFAPNSSRWSSLMNRTKEPNSRASACPMKLHWSSWSRRREEIHCQCKSLKFGPWLTTIRKLPWSGVATFATSRRLRRLAREDLGMCGSRNTSWTKSNMPSRRSASKPHQSKMSLTTCVKWKRSLRSTTSTLFLTNPVGLNRWSRTKRMTKWSKPTKARHPMRARISWAKAT